MRIPIILAASLMLAAPAAAQTCVAVLDELEPILQEAAEKSISTSSSGQGVAGAREAQAMEEGPEGEAEPVVPYQEPAEEVGAVEQAVQAGEGGDLVMRAMAMVDEARASAEGDEEACLETTRAALRMVILREAAE